MSSSPLSSTLSTPPKTKTEELPVGEELEEEQEEVEEEQDEEEQDDEEGEEIEDDEEHEDKSQHGVVQGPQADYLEPQPQQSTTDQPPRQRNQQRNKRVHQQKVIGTTILPVTRVTRAAKQDKDIKIVSKEAVFLISIATEFFVKKLTDSAFERSKKERRVFVKYNDVASAVKRNPEYDWLEEVIPTSLPLGTILRDPTIPSSSATITNSLPTDTLMKLNDQSSKQQSKVSLASNSHTDSLDTDSHPNPELPPIVDDGMDVDDQDELDEDL